MNRAIIAVATILFLCAPFTGLAQTQTARPISGTIIMARAGASPLYVWNATPYVAQLGADKLLGVPGMRALEATGITALADKARSLTTQSVSMRIVYEKTGAVSPIYRTATFEGLEDVVTLTADRKSLVDSAAAWTTNILAGATPHNLKVDVTGALPATY